MNSMIGTISSGFINWTLTALLGAVIIAIVIKFFKDKNIRSDYDLLKEKVKNAENLESSNKKWLDFATNEGIKNSNLIIERLNEKINPFIDRIGKVENCQTEIISKIDKIRLRLVEIDLRTVPRDPNKEKRKQKTILLLEDDEQTANVLMMWLNQKLGLFVWRVTSAKDGIDKVNYVDLAIADKTLDGDTADLFIEYCIENHKLYRNGKPMILLYSALNSVSKNKWKLPYIEKPVYPVDVGEKVVEMLEGR